MRAAYISHNSIGAALVRSQVLPYLRGLSADGVETDLITFERGGAFPEGEFPRSRWHGIEARRGSSLVAKAIDIATGALLLLTIVLRQRARVIHARSYVPAAIASIVAAITGRPYIFDMRGFLGEEYIDAGHWRPTDIRFRVLRVAERWMLRRAAHVVVLTEAAATRLRSDPLYAPAAASKAITVIPCAVDLERFRPAESRSATPTVVYSGSLGIAYDLDAMVRLYGYARALRPDLRLLFLNREAHKAIRAAIETAGLDGADIVVREATFDEMPKLVADCHVGLVLARDAISKSGSSPVKVAEYLACGLPVVVSPRLGDTDTLIARYDAGAVVATNDASLRAGAASLVALLDDHARRANARRLAEEEFALATGIARYRSIYRSLAG